MQPVTLYSAFRSASVDFINKLIDKHSLEQEKVKLVFVIHPNGKKFMSLILDLVMLATRENMKRRNIEVGNSFDIEKVTQACTNMKKIETDLSTSIKIEVDVIKGKTRAIQELIGRIFPENEFPLSFEEFIEAWHEYNMTQLSESKLCDEKMELIYKHTAELHARAHEMLLLRSYEITNPPLGVIQEVAAFYENAGVTSETISPPVRNDALNYSWLIAQLHLVLPAIMKYILNFSLDPSETSSEELKVLKRLSLELSKIDCKTHEFSAKFKRDMSALVAKLKEAKEERQRREKEILSPEILAETEAKDAIELEKLKLLTSPKYYLDTTKECLNHVVVKKSRLAFMSEDEGKENEANETKYYSRPKSSYASGNHSRLNSTNNNVPIKLSEMAPPKQKPRRRFDPMQMLEKATSNEPRNRQDPNSTTRYTGTIPKHSKLSTPKFSSTMLSPNFHQPLFNCSTVSEIMINSPVPQPPKDFFESMCLETMQIRESSGNFDTDFFQPRKQPVDSLSNQFNEPYIEMSPKGKLNPLVAPDEIFKKFPRLTLNEVTLVNETFPDSSEGEKTVVNQNANDSEGAACLSSSFSLGSDENLFNVSDSILKVIED